MASDYLTTIAASAGLERPVKVTKVVVENPTAGATVTIQDGSSGNNTLFETQFPTAGATVPGVPATYFLGDMWRNFKLAAVPAGSVWWIYRR